VLDPFLGSGTSLKVAVELGRRFVGYERLADLVPVIREKLGVSSKRVSFQTEAKLTGPMEMTG